MLGLRNRIVSKIDSSSFLKFVVLEELVREFCRTRLPAQVPAYLRISKKATVVGRKSKERERDVQEEAGERGRGRSCSYLRLR